MSEARHTPSGDASFRRSLLRNGVGAVGLVVLLAFVFWAIGSFGGPDDDALTVGEEPPDDAAEEPAAGDATEEPEPEPEPEPDPEPPADDGTTDDGGDEDGAADDGAADDSSVDDGTDDGSGEPPARTIDPGDVTIQVLDGYKQDGGAAADAVADQLDGEGYRIIARNDALSYDVTTVLYNPGNEEAARQVAADLGGAEVREQPGTLSTQVDLHVVVGADRA